MKEKHFYFINSKYYIDFPDNNLMQNKETVNGISHGRPCFFSFIDETTNLSWLIPISSKVGKYKRIYNKIENGVDENFQNLLVRIMNFYVDYENTS